MAAVLISNETATNIITLDSVRGELIRLEETIIFALIERSQFAVNSEIYAAGETSLLKQTANETNHSESFLDFFLEKTEQLHASLGRYTSPDEHPFLIDGLTVPLIQAQNYPASLRPNNININDRIKSIYEQKILPRICRQGSDGQYGSSATMDINVLQAISKRIHFGKFVAEAKFLRETKKFTTLIETKDATGLMNALTHQKVEDQVVERVTIKASTYGRDPTGGEEEEDGAPSYAIPPTEVGQLYREFVMPLNKDVQVLYLLQRLGGASIAFVESGNGSGGGGGGGAAGELAARAMAGSLDDDAILSCACLEDCFAMVKANNVARVCACLEENQGAISHITHRLLNENSSGLCITREMYFTKSQGGGRYVEISKSRLSPSSSTGSDKTSLSMGLAADAPGALSCVLSMFAKNGVNLLLISSSSGGGRNGKGNKSNFYVEVDGHASDQKTKDALEEVRSVADYCVVLGSYQKMAPPQ